MTADSEIKTAFVTLPAKKREAWEKYLVALRVERVLSTRAAANRRQAFACGCEVFTPKGKAVGGTSLVCMAHRRAVEGKPRQKGTMPSGGG